MPSKSGSSSGAEGTLSAEGKSSSPSTPSRRSSSKPRDGPGAARRADAAGGAGVTLEQILIHNFHNNRVEGLERTVSGEKGSQVRWSLILSRSIPFHPILSHVSFFKNTLDPQLTRKAPCNCFIYIPPSLVLGPSGTQSAFSILYPIQILKASTLIGSINRTK